MPATHLQGVSHSVLSLSIPTSLLNPYIPLPSTQGQIFGSRQAGQDEEKREEHVVISTYNSISQNILFSERGCEKAMAVIYPPPTAQAPHYLRASLISAGPKGGTPPTCFGDPFHALRSWILCFLTSNLNPSLHNQGPGPGQEEPQTIKQQPDPQRATVIS